MGYLTFALRLGIGGLLIVSGILKAIDGPALTIASVAGYRLLPPQAAALFGAILPYFEIVLGAYVALGLFTRIAAWVATALFSVFTVAVASATARGLTVNCGCFGAGRVEHPSWLHVSGDLLLVVISVAIVRFAPGAFAVDNVLAASKSELNPSERGTNVA